MDQISDAIAAGRLKSRTPLDQRFRDWLKANLEEQKKYNDISKLGQTTKLREQFRLDFLLQLRDAKTTLKKSSLREYQSVDAEMGTYQPVERVCEMEGGKDSQRARLAAMLYCSKCLRLGSN